MQTRFDSPPRAGLALALTALAALAGCGEDPLDRLECSPACPSGTHCTESGCVPDDGVVLDLAVPAPADLAGVCLPECTAPTPHCRQGRCVTCVTDDHCPAGQVCRPNGVVTACLPGCNDDSRCSGLACCDGACTDTARNPLHCGGCALACKTPHAAAGCAAGACTVARCDSGWQDCNASPGDGCEANLHFDVNNCGSCGTRCALANAICGCDVGGCFVSACNYGFEDCNSAPKDGCEISIATDSRNCGGCNLPCPAVSRAQVGCAAGACALQSCNAGYGDCNMKFADGCEVALVNDKAHCGRCGAACLPSQICANGECNCPVCSYTNAIAACIGKQCVLTGCVQGFGDCDGNVVNGCEQNIGSDVRNCGACGNACPQGLVCTNGGCTCPQCNIPNARTACVNNVCILSSCLPGYSDCDKNAVNGCEVATDSDPANCSGCGLACGGQTPYCVGGVCSAGGLNCQAILKGAPNARSGTYTIDPDGNGGAAPFLAYCDMATAGGGWTLVLNLDTSDGHAMWWGHSLWEDANVFGDVNTPFDGDHKSPAWNSLGGTTQVLLVVHEQGVQRGWKQFRKVDGRTMYQYFGDNRDNTLLGDLVLASDTAGIGYAPERMVRISTQLYVNHCLQNGGNCTSGGAGSPDGDRLGSHEAIPKNNDGGGLGNWTDMNYCCNKYGNLGSGKVCNNSTFRTTAEAQSGWAQCYSGVPGGIFGSDSFAAPNAACADANCDASNWAGLSGVNYDYALMLR